MTLERSYIGYLGFLVIDFLKSVLMYSKGAICLSRLLFKMGLFTVHHGLIPVHLVKCLFLLPLPLLCVAYSCAVVEKKRSHHWCDTGTLEY